jgi:molybdopterin-containing oxidoreductase family iron-sulfur binding subunit
MPELDRRDFLRIVGISAGAAAAAACQEPVETLIPYLNRPEEIVPGISTYYASTCRECPAACATRVTTREGRPIKVDGNSADPLAQGKLCVRGQASLHRTFDPARIRGPLARDAATERLAPTTWEAALSTLVEWLRPAAERGTVHFLGGLETGVLDGLIDRFLAALGSPRRVRFELFGHEALRAANRAVFGTDAIPHFAIDRADVLIAFGSDFLETWLNPVQNQVLYAKARREGKGFAVYVGPRLSASGQAMDVWLRTKPGTEIQVALALAGATGRAPLPAGAQVTLERAAEQSGVPLERLQGVARRLREAQAPLALPPGNELQGTNATAFAAAVGLLNVALGARGKTLLFGSDHNLGKLARFSDLRELAGRIRGGEVQVLLVHGANPVYTAPQVGLADALGQQSLRVVSFSSHADETTAYAHLVLPDHTPFESWGDAEPVRGSRRLQQPTVRPLFDTRAFGDVLIELARRLGKGDTLPASFEEALRAEYADWPAALQRGGVFDGGSGSAAPVVESAAPAPDLGGLRFEAAEITGEGDLDLLVYPSLQFYDGRSARAPMLQEIPNPVTKLTWGSFAELHPDTARALGVREFDVVRVSTDAGSVELPVVLNQALHPRAVAIEAGQGHLPVDPDHDLGNDRLRRRETVGVNALRILPGRLDPASGALAWLSSHCRVEGTGEHRRAAATQATFDQEGRGIAQAVGLASAGHAAAHQAESGEHAEDAAGGRYASAAHLETRPFDPAQDARDPSYRWGMSIDLDSCVGCNACMTACAQENNIPALGEALVGQGREMHWIRIERYVEERGEGDLEVRNLPMLCQHCGAAPCETVCPVYATYHNAEGLNVMVPNRCIGTRYCGNNCPYKVRRFNYFPSDFDYRFPETLRLNPDVMVRAKGVMEKCTFCVQRINAAKDQARLEGRTVREGEVTTACADGCPSQAIRFGNYKDPESAVSRARRDPRAYSVLHHLHTRPAITYLKKVLRDGHEKA